MPHVATRRGSATIQAALARWLLWRASRLEWESSLREPPSPYNFSSTTQHSNALLFYKEWL